MAIESSVLSGLEPAAFWQRFDELTTIARPSRREDPVIAHVERWADSRGFVRRSDAARKTGTTTLGKRVIDHSFQLPLQIAWISTALVGIGIVAVFGI
jgi:hypothetical protein